MPGNFSDSNVLIYPATQDLSKAVTVKRLLVEGLTISVQVLNEIANVLRRKRAADWAEVRAFLAGVEDVLDVVDLTYETHRRGLALAQRHQFAIYDAMIVAAALLADCDVLYSEDMHHGLLVEGTLRIVNPFRDHSPAV